MQRTRLLLSRNWFAPSLAAALVTVIGVWLSATLNIWIDEAYTVHTTGSGPAYALHQATAFELQPPLYFLLLATWRLIDEGSIAFARLPSVALAAAAAAIMVIAARRLAPRIPGVAVAVAIALNPIVLWAATEMRVYPLVLLLTATLTLAFLYGFLAPLPSRSAQVWYTVAGIAGLYTHYYIGFVLFAFAVILTIVRRGTLVPFLVANTTIALAFLPFIPVALQQFRDASVSELSDGKHVSIVHALHEMINANFVYILPHEISWTGLLKKIGFATAAALLGILCFVGRPRLNGFAGAITSSWLLATLIYSLVFALAGEALEVRRHALAIAPLAILSSFALLSGLRAHRRPLLLVATLTYAVYVAGSLWWSYKPPLAKGGDWRHVASIVTSSNADGPVVVFPANLTLALEQYLPSRERMIPFPQPMLFTANYLDALKLRDEAQVADAFREMNIHSAHLWLISDNSCDTGPQLYDFSCQYLESYLLKHYVVRVRYLFRGAAATLYDRAIPSSRR